MNAEIARHLNLPDVLEELKIRAWVANISTRSSFTEKIKSDIVKRGKIIQELGIKPE